MQFSQFQPPTSLLKRYFQNHPDRLKTYVRAGIIAANMMVMPVSAMLRHLIKVQDMDPDEEPGRHAHEVFQQALDACFQQYHDHDFDTGFDFSWFKKKFAEVRMGFPLDLTEKEYHKITDVSQLQDPPTPTNTMTAIPPANQQSGITVAADQSQLEELAAILESPIEDNKKSLESADQIYGEYTFGNTFDTSVSLKEALEKLVKIAKHIEGDGDFDPNEAEKIAQFLKEQDVETDPKALFAKTELLKNMRAAIVQQGAPMRALKKTGKMRRTPTGNTKAVKRAPRKSPKIADETRLRKEAKEINKLIAEGKISPADLDPLVMEGLDLRSVNYWEEHYGDKHFIQGSTLKQKLKAQFAAATDLANEMAARGLCTNTPGAIEVQVQDLLKFNDESFQSLKNVVMNHPRIENNDSIKDFASLEDSNRRVQKSNEAFKLDMGAFRRTPPRNK